MADNLSFRRFFNPDKSPHTQINPLTGVYDRIAKHHSPKGRIVWDSLRKGPYVRALHGELPGSKYAMRHGR